MPTKASILGVEIDALTRSEAIELIINQASSNEPSKYIVKPYVEFFDRASQDSEIRTLLNQAWLKLPEGVSAQWAAAYLSGQPGMGRAIWLAACIIIKPQAIASPIKEKFGGTVFTWELLEACAAKNLKVYLIGSPKNSSIESTSKAIKQRLPHLEITGTWPGQWGGMSGEKLRQRLQSAPIEAKLLADINKSSPQVILAGMGFPLQEELIAKLAPQLQRGVLIGEGGTFDYSSFGGNRTKAPQWLQKSGLEWLWRLVLEPSRWRRQMAIPRFMWKVYHYHQGKTISSLD